MEYTYRVVWSDDEQEHVGLCDQFPGLSHGDTTTERALEGIQKLVAGVVANDYDEHVYSGPRVPLLDHGYIQLVERWGSERQIVEAARQSTQKGFEGWGPKRCACAEESSIYGILTWHHDAECSKCGGSGKVPGDEKLLAYLWKNRHDTPFEMAGLTFEVQAPIFVFREWHRHRVPFGYSEASARYAPLPALDYLPTVERLMQAGPTRNKQAASAEGAKELDSFNAQEWLDRLERLQMDAENVYQQGLEWGVPKELARLAMTVGRYSRMRATGNLRGWLAFLALRNAPTAQKEIRVYAEAIDAIVAEHFPHVHAIVREGGRA